MILKNKRWIFAVVLSALLAVLSHPTVFFGVHFPDLHGLAWVAYGPLFLVVLEEGLRVQLRRLALFGYLFNLGAMYWLYTAMNTFGHLSPALSVLVLLILATVFTAYLLATFWIADFLKRQLRLPVFWSLPLVWVSLAWILGRWPIGGSTWGQVGYSQAPWNTMIQVADLTGVFGITALILWVNLSGVELVRYFRKQSPLAQALRRLSLVAFFFLGTLAYGVLAKGRLEGTIATAPKVSVGLLQGDIPQDEKWAAGKAPVILQTYQDLTQQAIDRGAQIVVWPEASFPFDLALDHPNQVRFAGKYPKDVIVGAVTYESQGKVPLGSFHTPKDFPIHSSAFLLQAGGTLGGAYHKRHLVPYGEYIPFKSIFPFLNKLTEQIGEFQPGNAYVLLNSGEARIGSLICYEDIFPEISSGHVNAGANLLVNLTNDAWYGDSSALPQHLNFSPFRAVENRRALVRATNNGVTASVDPLGRIRKTLPSFGRGILMDEVSLVSVPTFYAKYGDVFAYGCMGIVGMMALVGLVRKIKM